MEIIFDNLTWRDSMDKDLCTADFNTEISLNSICIDIDKKLCHIHGFKNEEPAHFPFYAWSHTNQGLERTTILYAKRGMVHELVIFPNGEVAVIWEPVRAPQWAADKEKHFCW